MILRCEPRDAKGYGVLLHHSVLSLFDVCFFNGLVLFLVELGRIEVFVCVRNDFEKMELSLIKLMRKLAF